MTGEQLQRANELTKQIKDLEQHQQYLPNQDKLDSHSTDLKLNFAIRGGWDQYVLKRELLPITLSNLFALYAMALAKKIEDLKAELAAL